MKNLNFIEGIDKRVTIDDLKKEMQSLNSITSKRNKSYLDHYNIMVRHLSILLYYNGFKFKQRGIHKTIVEIINSMLDCIDSSSIVRARHKLKYEGIEPINKVYKELSILTSFLIIKNKLKDY